MTTIAEHRAENDAREEKRRQAERLRRLAVSELPDHLPMPTVSNETEKGGLSPTAWLSFSISYGETRKGSEILAALELAGYEAQPASIVQWDNYRHHPEAATCEELPDTKPGVFGRAYALKDCAPLFPLWLEANPHTKCCAVAFYRSPARLLLRVCVPGPSSFYATAERVEVTGDWYYKGGTQAPQFPQAFHDAASTGGLQIECHTRAHLLQPQGLDAVLYFEPIEERPSATPATLLAALEGSTDSPQASR